MANLYFRRLNYHRPVFTQASFMSRLSDLYTNDDRQMDDAGFICSVYLILALATLSALHHPSSDHALKNQLTNDFPSHEDLFYQALKVKPELRVAISSLQAHILLHWYMYIEVRSSL